MKVILILLNIGLFLFIMKMILDIQFYKLIIEKNKEINQAENELEKDYQFIKGLY